MKKFFMIIPLVILLCFTFSCQQGEEVAEATKESFDIKIGYVAVNGTKLYYEIAGEGDPIVFIHGHGGDRRHWDDQFEVFAKSHKVIRYDVRGFGKSSMPVEGERYSHYEDLKALLDFLSINKAHMCGLSMGSGIAVDFVLAYPEMSSSLIAVGPWAFGYDSPAAGELREIFGKFPSIIKESGTEAAINSWGEAPYLKKTKENPLVFERLKDIGKDYSFWHYLHQDPKFILDPPAVQQFNKINLPALIITAEYDLKACREIADLLEKNNPNAKKLVIADAGHLMNMEKPEEFNKAVLDFLKELE